MATSFLVIENFTFNKWQQWLFKVKAYFSLPLKATQLSVFFHIAFSLYLTFSSKNVLFTKFFQKKSTVEFSKNLNLN